MTVSTPVLLQGTLPWAVAWGGWVVERLGRGWD